MPENTAANTNVGAAIPAATDADADTLTYTLEGTDASSFTFDAAARQIKTKASVTYDHEAKSSYSVTVKVSDGTASDTVTVTINVTDVAEPPAKPAAPSVSGASTTSLSVSWSAPTNTGKPAITNYDLRYRAGTGGSWSNGPQNVTGTTATISSLTAGTSHQVQVRATNAEGDGPWSDAGTGSTNTSTPAAPTGLGVSAGNAKLDLTWTAPTGAVTGYHVHYTSSSTVANDAAASGNDPASAWVAVTRSGTTAAQTITGLTNGTAYRVRVRAVNAAGNGAWARGSGTPGAPAAAAVLVSNVGQTHAGNFSLGTTRAQQFTTGSHAAGYSLSSIDVRFGTAVSTATLGVELWSAKTDGTPDTRLKTLTVPSAVGAGTVSFAAPADTVLAANTKYFVRVESTGATTGNLAYTGADAEDAGAATGWSIANTSHDLIQNMWGTSTNSLMIRVNGAAAQGVWSATLTAKGVRGNPATGFGCSNTVSGAECSTASVLTDDDFTIGGTTYSILRIEDHPNDWLYMEFDRAVRTPLLKAKLCVGSTAYDFPTIDGDWGNGDKLMRIGADVGWPAWAVDDTYNLKIGFGPTCDLSQHAETLTVAQIQAGFLGCDTSAATAVKCSNTAVLSDDDFTYGGATYEAYKLYTGGGKLHLELKTAISAALKAALTLKLGGTSFRFADGTLGNGAHGANTAIQWATAPSWNVGDVVTVAYEGGATQSTDASLSGLYADSAESASGTYSDLTLTPAFATGTTAYTASVANSITHVKLEPSTTHSGASIKVGKGTALSAVSSGTASAAIALAEGANAIKVEVTAEDGTTKRVYTVTVTRAAQSTNANLSALTASKATSASGTYTALSIGTFAKATTAYTASVANDVTHVKLTPTREHTGASIKVGKGASLTAVSSGTASSAIALSVGANAIKAEVTAQDGTTKRVYTVTVTRAAANSAPSFSASSLSRSVPENTAANTNVGAAIPAATDADADTLTYTLEGTDASSFTFDAAARQIKTKASVTYDHEAKSSYTVTVKVSDGAASDTVPVTISVTDVAEPPAKPAAPSVSGASTTSLSVSWSAPTNTGKPAITNYDLRYRAGTGGSWSNGPQNVTGTTATISSLTAGTSHQVQVRATNAEGDGPWSDAGTGSTNTSTPAAPTGLGVSAGNAKLDLTWTAPTGAVTGYHVHYTSSSTVANDAAASGNDPASAWVAVTRSGTTAAQTITGLTNGTAYRVRVRAVNAAGNGAWARGSGTPGAPAAAAVLVSTVGQTASTTVGRVWENRWHTQGFTTGTHAAGYTLTSIEARTNQPEDAPSELRAQLWSDSNGSPGSKLADLTVPATITASASTPANIAFAAPANTTLAASTTYHFVIGGANTRSAATNKQFQILNTTSDNEDSGAATGWSIADASYFANGANGNPPTGWGSFQETRLIRVNGAAKTASTTTPAAPTNLRVSSTSDARVSLRWTAPAGTLTGYDLHYTSAPATGTNSVSNTAAASGNDPSMAWVAVSSPPGATATFKEISGLDNGTTYRVRLRAKNTGGNGAWAFTSGTPNIVLDWPDAIQTLAEGGSSGFQIRLTPSAVSTAVSGTLTYAAGTTNGASLSADLQSGYATTFSANANQIPAVMLAVPVNDTVNEEHETFTVTLNAGTGYVVGTQAKITVTIEDNAPPAAPSGLSLTAGSGKLSASWTKPAGPVTGYQLRHKTTSAANQAASTPGNPSTGWVTSTASITTTSAEITGLTNGTAYHVQVRATDGQTQTGNGYGAWSASQSGTPAVATQSTNANLSALTASKATSASGTYTALSIGTFAKATTAYTASVANDVTHVKLTPTREHTGASIKVGKGASLTAVSSGTASSAIALSVGANAIKAEVTAQDGTTKRVYTVTVTRAAANSAPSFSASSLTRSVAENSAANTNVGAAIPAATDADTGDTLTYTLEGTDASSFTFDASARQIKTKNGVTYDHEAKSSYTVTVKVSDGAASDTVPVTISVTDVAEPPAKPAAPSVSGASTTSLSVSWSAPTNTGKPAITNYDLRYRAGSSGNWSNGPQNVTSTTATISSLTAGTSHQVQVRATNAEGDGPWSDAGTGSTNTQSTNANLSALTASKATSASGTYTALSIGTFAKATTAYTASVANDVTHVKLTPTREHTGASIKVGKGASLTAVSSGTASSAIALAEGANAVKVEVTAEDGTTKRVYTVTVTRAPAACDGIWCATLTVRDLGSGYLGCANNVQGASNQCTAAATLTEDQFTLSGGTHTVYFVYTQPNNNLEFALTGAVPAALSGYTLHVGATHSYDFADAQSSGNIRYWGNARVDLGWTASDTVALRLKSTAATTTPSVTLSAFPNPVTEGSSVTVTARLSAALTGAVTIPVTLTRGTAESGDVGTLTGITIASGQTSGTGTVTTAQDTGTDDETFTVALGSLPSSVTAGTPNSVTVVIADDDGGGTPPPGSGGGGGGGSSGGGGGGGSTAALRILHAEPVVEGSRACFRITLDEPPRQRLDLLASTASGTATEGTDFEGLSRRPVTVPPGESELWLEVATKRDAEEEDEETFTVTLSVAPDSAPARVVRPEATGRILNGPPPETEVPLFLAGGLEARHGFLRVLDLGGMGGPVSIAATDDGGVAGTDSTLRLAPGGGAHFRSSELEGGSAAKGLTPGTGAPTRGDWRLLLSNADVGALAYVRTRDGFVTPLVGTVPVEADGGLFVAFFNPGSNWRQVSLLRLANPGEEPAKVTVAGIDDSGASGTAPVRLTLPGGTARVLSAQELERGASGLDGKLGDGRGKWRLMVSSDRPVVAMGLLESPTGHLANLSGATGPRTDGGDGTARTLVPLFPAADDPDERQGFVRLINRGAEAAEVGIEARDDAGQAYPSLTLTVGAHEAVQFNSDNLELGAPAKGLPLGTGSGEGAWRLELTAPENVMASAYIRHLKDGFVTGMNALAPVVDGEHRVDFLNPASNTGQVSLLRLINPGASEAEIVIQATDDAGVLPGTPVSLTLPPRTVRTLTSVDLESGADGLEGALGDGKGKWRLRIASDEPIRVMSLLASPTGHLANLSAGVAAIGFAGAPICADAGSASQTNGR